MSDPIEVELPLPLLNCNVSGKAQEDRLMLAIKKEVNRKRASKPYDKVTIIVAVANALTLSLCSCVDDRSSVEVRLAVLQMMRDYLAILSTSIGTVLASEEKNASTTTVN